MAGKRFLSWEEYAGMVEQLARRLDMLPNPVRRLRAIPRGGLVPATMLSHRLGIPYHSELSIAPESGQIGMGPKTWLVDDILDTGRTLIKALTFGMPKVVAVVVAKPAGVEAWNKRLSGLSTQPYTPILVVGHVYEGDDWLVFPYENQVKEERDAAHQ